jgi:hypothetical protein
MKTKKWTGLTGFTGLEQDLGKRGCWASLIEDKTLQLLPLLVLDLVNPVYFGADLICVI